MSKKINPTEIHIGSNHKCDRHGHPVLGSDPPTICPNSGVHNQWEVIHNGFPYLIVFKGEVDPTDPIIQKKVDEAIDKWIEGK